MREIDKKALVNALGIKPKSFRPIGHEEFDCIEVLERCEKLGLKVQYSEGKFSASYKNNNHFVLEVDVSERGLKNIILDTAVSFVKFTQFGKIK